MSEPADAGPAFGLHLVEVFKAGKVSSGIGSSGLSGLLADGVGSSEVINASDLHGLGALVGSCGSGEDSEECEEGNNNDGSHL